MPSSRRGFLLQVGAAPLLAQSGLLGRVWTAKWISAPGAPATEYCVCHFRRTLELTEKPARFLVHASGDNRYQLFVNGIRVCWGPARGDLFHWRYETIDLAPYLQTGRNVLAAVVWNFGDLAPQAQITLQTGFLLQGDTEAERVAETGPAWKALRNEAYSPLVFTNAQMRGYYVAGPGDRLNASKHPWGWETRAFDDSAWKPATVVGAAAGREAIDSPSRWMLAPRSIPAMEERPEAPMKQRRGQAMRFGPHSSIRLLYDQTYLTTAYPELTVSGGKDAVVRLRYAEALFPKTNRDEIEGKEFIGNYDEFVADGGRGRTFRPLWWRTYRYLQVEIDTNADPLTIDSLTATYTGYPFERRARFDAGDEELGRILDVGWRTARLCAHETYMDCPYYEQLQYVGDTRVQCLVSLFNSGDARLMRNAIDQINDSRQSDGATMSRFPTRLEQYIPAFSLWWIGMVRDYWWYVDDPAFVRRMLPGVRAVLSFFEPYQNADASLRMLPWWRYFDWVPSWPRGQAPQEEGGTSALFDLLLLMAYQWAADLDTSVRVPPQLAATIQRLYWDPERRLYADTPRKSQFSQHANTLAVLAGVIRGEPARNLMLRILTEPNLAQAEIFFRYYVNHALTQVGEGNRYLDQLGDWREMLARGLTTFAEWSDRPGRTSRSDCHAWSASPNIELFRTVLGVDSAAPGFRRVVVRPHPGKLARVSGIVPHPLGTIEVAIDERTAVITVPVPGEFTWRGATHPLVPGVNRF
jgi:hypothetical protein